MRSRRTTSEEMAAIARRRLDLLSAELAGIRGAMPPAEESEAQAADDPREPADPPGEDARREAPPGRHARRRIRASGRIGGWLHDRLPPTLQGRVALGAAHLSVVALLVAVAFAVTAWWVVRADGPATVVPSAADLAAEPSQTPVEEPSPLVEGVADPAAAGVGSSTEAGVVVVDVAGKVRRPGIVTLPVGSRVVDAIEAAGGIRRGVDLTSVNLARVLVDGEQVLVGVPPARGVAAAAAAGPVAPGSEPGRLVNINTASAAELEVLPGVGPVTAAAILQWRADNGPFSAVDELLEVSGIGEATLSEMAPFVTL